MKANSLKNNVRQFGQYVEVVANRKTFQDQFFCLTLLTAKTFWETGTNSCKYRYGRKTRFCCILRDRFDPSKSLRKISVQNGITCTPTATNSIDKIWQGRIPVSRSSYRDWRTWARCACPRAVRRPANGLVWSSASPRVAVGNPATTTKLLLLNAPPIYKITQAHELARSLGQCPGHCAPRRKCLS